MKCLSLWQPWATLFALGLKRLETRHWFTSYRGPLLIHAAKKKDRESLDLCNLEPFRSALAGAGLTAADLPFGFIIGCNNLAEIWVCQEDDTLRRFGGDRGSSTILSTERAFGNYCPGRYAWESNSFRPFKTPIPYRGLQQIFNVPDELVAEQLAKAVPA